MNRRSRRASVLLIAIAITTVCVSLAFGYLASVRAVLPGAGAENHARLARAAARMGANHAMAALLDNYCRSPNTPTHYRQRVFAGFAPIDSGKVGWWTPGITDNRPWGAENTAEDANGNDVPAEETLSEAYLQYKGEDLDRLSVHTQGMLRGQPLGRWIEPGAVAADLVAQPVSFHLQHPVAADPASPDPAVRAGEPWTPPAAQPGASWFDAELRPVATRAAARYRLRYAVGLEDLAGHILLNLPAPWQQPANSAAAGGVPTADDAWRQRELDRDAILRWRDSFAAMVLSRPDSDYYYGVLAQFLGLGLTGPDHDGARPQDGKNYTPLQILHSLAGDVPQVLCDWDQNAALPVGEPDGVYTTLARPRIGFADTALGLRAAMRGPLLDIEQLRTLKNASEHVCTFTPYGRGSRYAAAPTDWDEAPTDCPWRLNVPTMTIQAVFDMVYAFLPVEARTYRYPMQEVQDYLGVNPDGSAKWSTAVVTNLSPGGTDIVVSGSRLRDSPGFAAMLAGRRPVPLAPYPGMAVPGGMAPATGTHWRTDLGVMLSSGSDRSVSMLQFNRGRPLHGMSETYFRNGPWSLLVKEERFAGGQRITLRPGGANFYSLAPNQAYTHHGSYWWDVGTALLQTFGTALHVWHGETGASHAGAPSAGLPQWPVGHRLATQPPAAAPAAPAPAIDRDADGDGVAESPSLLDSVEEMDRLFICNMGEWWGDFAYDAAGKSGRPATPAPGLYVELKRGDGFTGWNTAVPRLRGFDTANQVPGGNIRSLLDAGSITADEARSMELVLNDTRLSFFGSSPQHPGFRGIDFDGDGTVWCAGYDQGRAKADPATGKARRIRRADVAGDISDPLRDQHVCLTGYVVFQQSRFFRVVARGELWDELLGRAVAKADLESVVAIDPNGSLYDVNGAPKASWNASPAQCSGLGDSQVLWQRWLRSLNLRPTAAVAP